MTWPLPSKIPVKVPITANSPVKDLSAGQVRIQVDVGGQDEVLVVVVGSLAEGDQVFCCSNLVRIVRFSCAATVFGIGR
jgi:hypothetical protein